MHSVMPVLQVSDVNRSVAFYRDLLGFTVNGTWGDGPEFAIIQRGKVSIALDRSRDDGPAPVNQYWAAYIYVDDADALHEEFAGRDVDIVRGLENSFYGMREFDVRDPDGHIIAFAHDLDSASDGPGLTDPDKSGG